MIFSLQPKIELFVRHCHYSSISEHKNRFFKFDREKCHENLLTTIDPKKVKITFFLDTFHPLKEPHFITKQNRFPVVEIKEGTEAGSFLRLLDYIAGLSLKDETILYFLEDDYLHRKSWVDILLEGFTIPDIDYVTLFDHRDKYFHPLYSGLTAKLMHTASCHWRTTPSTTNTFAVRWKTLKNHLLIHRAYSENRSITADHEKFCHLKEHGATLISSIPGFATHVEKEYASPCIDWEKILINTNPC